MTRYRNSKLWSRREWMARVGVGAASTPWLAAGTGIHATPAQRSAREGILPLSSTSEVFVPPRGRSYMKFSFDFPEPSIEIDGLRVGFLVFTYENTYGLDADAMRVERADGGARLVCDGFVWAGGQMSAPGRLEATFRRRDGFLEWEVSVAMEQPVKAVSTVVRGVPRGRISCSGQSFFDPEDNEILLGYPFSGGDLFGPGSARGMPTPFAVVESGEGEYFSVSSLDDRVRTKRLYFQPGESSYRLEAVHETEGWLRSNEVNVPAWRVGRTRTMAEAAAPHFAHLERAYGIPSWETRTDAPDWLRDIALVITLHGMHFTGYVFNDYARMLEILRWVATRIPASRVVAFLSSWDGRYYWDYPLYTPDERMGDEAGFRALVEGGQELGFRMMPMFGANAANRKQPVFRDFADAFTEKIDGDRFDLNWVDWDNDRHQDGWLSYMNLGVASWREHLMERISEAIERFRPDAYFLDIVGGWVNNPKADMHEGTRLLVEGLRAQHPDVLAVGEMHYDALLSFIPIYHSFSQTEVARELAKYTRFFQHLSYPAPGRGSTGVHEAGFRRSREDAFALSEAQLPTLNVVDDTFDEQREGMEAVIRYARERAGL